MDLSGYRMILHIRHHPEYDGIGDYFGTEKPRRHINCSAEQWVQIAESLADEHGGVLPCVTWIQENHPGLGGFMYKRPELFVHVPQDKPHGHHRTPEQWVVFAEALAVEHGGVLPCVKWIRKRHAGLCYAMWSRPELFAHIPQDKKTKSPEEWVALAEAVAAENGGAIPSASLINKNHPGLYHAMRKYPGFFSHIPQERRGG